MDVDSPSGSNGSVVPLSELQSRLLRLLANQRSPDSYVAGGVPINRDGPRYSDDIDIFHDSDAALAATADGDAAILAEAGFSGLWQRREAGIHSLIVRCAGESMKLEWVADSDFRFFPAVPDELFGYVLHPADLATNKAAAAAGRRVPRDIVDLLTIHHRLLPLGAVVAAAVGRFPGMTPEEMLADIKRHSTFTANEFEALATQRPLDPRQMHKQIKAMLEAAETFIRQLPSDAVGFLFLDGDKPIQPDVAALDLYRRHIGTRRGHWPSSAEIGSAMLERYRKFDE